MFKCMVIIVVGNNNFVPVSFSCEPVIIRQQYSQYYFISLKLLQIKVDKYFNHVVYLLNIILFNFWTSCFEVFKIQGINFY